MQVLKITHLERVLKIVPDLDAAKKLVGWVSISDWGFRIAKWDRDPGKQSIEGGHVTDPNPQSAIQDPQTPAHLAVLLSGSGRTLVNLVESIRSDVLRDMATIDLVIASKECLGAERARAANIETLVMKGVIPRDELGRVLDSRRIDLVVCAGYLKYLHVPPAYSGRVVNIHPALLPKFGGPGMYGDRVHAAVIAAGEKESGCTVHLVDEVYDHGQIILQRTCPVLPGDDVHTLAARVFEQECIAYPEALVRLIRSRSANV
jgi:phosphoribosylglycinamide formyltransferase 1